MTVVAATREDLDPRAGECLLCYLDRMLARTECAGELALVRWWNGLRAPRATTLAPRLRAHGAGCDCEVLTRLYERRPGLAAAPRSVWDGPRCAGVHRGSAQPCRAWRRRQQWV